MKTIGLLGGMSWESTAEYYRLINQFTNELLGQLHSAELLLYSVDFAPIERLQHEDKWDELTSTMIKHSKKLQVGGAECLVICTNTMHRMADDIQKNVDIPLIHIADATASQARKDKQKVVGLLGTRFTMEQDFYRGRLENVHDLTVKIPSAEDRDFVHRVIYEELCKGVIHHESKERYLSIIEQFAQQGAQSVILGCTEIGMLVRQEEAFIPVLDSTEIHARAAVNWALGEDK